MTSALNLDQANYRKCMEEIKRRQNAIAHVAGGTHTTPYLYTNVEFIALQYRKIFELIILATLASHEHLFEGLTRKLSKEWRLSNIATIVRKKNPKFYPVPIDHGPSVNPNAVDSWIEVRDGFLTFEELVAAHGKINELMHANNPFKEGPLIEEFQKLFPIWTTRLVRLLNCHLITFPGDEMLLYVAMQAKETGNVSINVFQKKSNASSDD
jgi:hypothetical protein